NDTWRVARGSLKRVLRRPLYLPAVGASCAVSEFPFHHGPRFIDSQRAAIHLLAVVGCNSLLGVLVAPRYETKTFRPARIAVCNDAHGFDRTDLLKHFGKFIFGRSER